VSDIRNRLNAMNESSIRRNFISPLLISRLLAIACGTIVIFALLFQVAFAQDASESASSKAEADTTKAPAEVIIPWNYHPYSVKVWLFVDQSPRWSPAALTQLCDSLERQMRTLEPSAWTVSAEAAPMQWQQSLGKPTLEKSDLTAELYEAMDGLDKLFLVRINDNLSDISLAINEVDVNGWSLGPLYQSRVMDSRSLSYSLVDAMAGSFRPIALIDHTAGDLAFLKIRAHDLMYRAVETAPEQFEMVADKASPCWLEKGEVFEPILRRSNRQKKYALKDIENLDVTLLVQQDSNVGQDVTCKIVSANSTATALGRRSGKRTQRLGIAIRAPEGTSKLKLITKRGTSRLDLQEFSLSGYEIYSRSIYGNRDSMEYLGKTDWTGTIEIAPGSERVRLLLVQSGERSLARLPIMPGYKPQMQILLPDDEARITAEGVVSGLRIELLDLVVRRKVLIERAKISLEGNDLKSADQFYTLYSDLMNLNQWNDYLATIQRRLATNDRRQQTKIDKMFVELRESAQAGIKVEEDGMIQEMMLKARKAKSSN